MPPGRRILVLAPHPDDEVVACAATIVRAVALGAEVFVAVLTEGIPEASSLWPWDRAGRPARVERRRAESREAARFLGHELAWQASIPSRRLLDHVEETLRRIEETRIRLEIDALWVPAFEGGHQDHDTANWMASTFVSRLRASEFSEYNFAGGQVESQAFPRARGDEVAIALDPEERARKVEALALYRSERRNLRHTRADREVWRSLHPHDYGRPPHPGRLFWTRYSWASWHPRVDPTPPESVYRRLGELARARNQGSVPGSSTSASLESSEP